MAAARSAGAAEVARKPLPSSSTSSVAALSGRPRDHAGHALRGGLDHHHPVSLAHRGQHHAQRTRHGRVHLGAVHEAVRAHRLAQAELLDPALHLRALGAVAVDVAAQRRQPLPGDSHRVHQRGHVLLGDVAAGEDHRRAGRLGVGAAQVALVLALEDGDLAAKPLVVQPGRVQPREAEGTLADPRAQPLHPRRRRPPPARGTRASRCASTPRASRPPRSSGPADARARAASREKYGNDAVCTTSYRRPRSSRWASTPAPKTSGGRIRRRPPV